VTLHRPPAVRAEPRAELVVLEQPVDPAGEVARVIGD